MLIATGYLAVAAAPASAASYAAPNLRQRIDLNPNWKFFKGSVAGAQNPAFDDSAWQGVSVPHTWNATDAADGGANYYRGDGWYRRKVTVSPDLAGKQLFLQFAGANQTAEVWVNGRNLGKHEGGNSRFRFNATSSLRVGPDNVVAVKVNNQQIKTVMPQLPDYSIFGGIYRNVSLWAVDPLQVRMLDSAGPGVYLRQHSVTDQSATVEVTTKVWNNTSASRPSKVRTVITDATGMVVTDTTAPVRTIAAQAGADVKQTVTISNPHRWNGAADPYLYRANVEVWDAQTNRVTDVVTEPLGLRTFSVDPDKGFFLNGRYQDLHGVNLHQDRKGRGWAINDADRAQDFDMIKDIGATALRLAHYQHDQQAYDLADKRGLVVWAEIPNVNDTIDAPAYTANAEQQLTELIRQNYNHPSIVFWSIGNEQRVDNAAANALLDRLAGVVEREDPDRFTAYASCCISDTGPANNHSEVNGYNTYFGWYGGEFSGFGRWADDLHAREPKRKIAVTEYGGGANVTQHALNPSGISKNPGGQYHPEEYQSLLHEATWKQMKTRRFLWGKFVWNMFDFAIDYRNEGAQPGINDKGLVTYDRSVRKDSYYWYRANWSPQPTLHITSRRWTQRTDAATEVKVYSNADNVSLTLNGKSLGSKTSADHIFNWTGVTLIPGTNTVTATATINDKKITDTVTWALG